VGSKISTSRSAFPGGLMQAPAVGRGLCELLLHGRYQTLDLSRLGYRRILDGMPLRDEVPRP
jgi:FAD-dependent oxidoreductase domain-containing protein 1